MNDVLAAGAGLLVLLAKDVLADGGGLAVRFGLEQIRGRLEGVVALVDVAGFEQAFVEHALI